MKTGTGNTDFSTPESLQEKETLQRFFEHAPKTEGNPEILGYWTEEGNYICSECASSIMARGCRISIESYVWEKDNGPVGVCICC